MSEHFERVRIYLSEQDLYNNQPLHSAVLRILQQEGASGATVLSGVAGFGPRQRARTADFVLSAHTPLVIEWIDRVKVIEHVLPLLGELLRDALITREAVHLYQARVRAQGPFHADLGVGDVMQQQVPTATPDQSLNTALALMLDHALMTLPVVDEHGNLAGVVRDVELLRRADIPVPLRLMHLLNASERSELLAATGDMLVATVMNSEPRSIYSGAALPQALTAMIEWSYEQIPVIAREGTLLGLLGSEQILQAAASEQAEHTAEIATTVQLVMQEIVPTIHAQQPAGDGLVQLVTSALRYVVVVDEARQVLGDLDDVYALQQLAGEQRAAFLAAVQQAQQREPIAALPLVQPVLDIARREVATLAPQDHLLAAAHKLMQQPIRCAPVVDSSNQLCGVLTRSGLLRALVQES